MFRPTAMLLAVSLVGGVGTAQTAGARLEGTILSVTSGLPVSGVIVSIPAANRLVASNDSGRFAFEALPAGNTGVRVAVLGRSSASFSFRLDSGRTKRIQVLVDPGAVELDPIVVRAANLENRWGMSGFYARRQIGFGYFITRAQIEQRHYLTIQEALGAAGVFYTCETDGCGPTVLSRGRRCMMSLTVDGLPGFGEELEVIPASEIAGIEVYKNNFDMPLTFTAGFIDGTTVGRCGAIALWTRDWRSDLPADW